MNIEVGAYCLATKYSDGDPQDHWAVGFYDGILPKSSGDRYMLVDSDGVQLRANGFRKIEAISAERGTLLLRNARLIEQSEMSLWDWCGMALDEMRDTLK